MANFNFNKVIIGGRLTGDPVLKVTPSGVQVCTFSVAVNRRFTVKDGNQAESDFFDVTAWRQTAEFVGRYFRKASSICVVGHIETRSWIGQDGQKRFRTEIVADEAYFVDAKAEMPATQARGVYDPAQGTYVPQGYAAAPVFEELADDGDCRFSPI